MGFLNKIFGGGRRRTEFSPSAELMQEDKFWKIIQTAFNHSNGDYERQQEKLAHDIGRLNAQEIILFENRFRQLQGLAYNWQLWGAIYIIHGGCSDDSFSDFREWLIGQGKEFYYKTLADPESLADIDADSIEIDWEGMGYIARTVFAELTGQDLPAECRGNHEITGEVWDEEGDDLKKMFPRLWAKFNQ